MIVISKEIDFYKTDFHDVNYDNWENTNSLARKFTSKIFQLGNEFLQKTNLTPVFLVGAEIFWILDSTMYFKNVSTTMNNINQLRFEYFGGYLQGYELYYRFKIDKIYCSDKIENIGKFLLINERKEKIEKIEKI